MAEPNSQYTTKRRGCGYFITRTIGCFIALAVVLVVAALAGGYLYQWVASAADAKAFPPPGQLVDLGGYKLHVFAKGSGSPAVILDGASLDTVSGWHWMIEEISPVTQVIAYDRPGLGWSDLGPEPRDVELNCSQLHQALEKSGVKPPYILVGHSLGGLYTRAFAGKYPKEVAGIVQIEATHPDFPARLGLPNVMPNADKNMLAVAPYAARVALLRVMHMFPPDANLPERQQQELQTYYVSNNFADRTLSAYNRWPSLLAQAGAVKSFGDIPLRVVIGGASENAKGAARQLQEESLKLSANSKLTVVDGADHISLVHNRDYAHDTAKQILELVQEARKTK